MAEDLKYGYSFVIRARLCQRARAVRRVIDARNGEVAMKFNFAFGRSWLDQTLKF